MDISTSNRDADRGDIADCALILEKQNCLSGAMKLGIMVAAGIPTLIVVVLFLSAAGMVLTTAVVKGDLIEVMVLTIGVALLILAVMVVATLLSVLVGSSCGWLTHRLFFATGVPVKFMTVVFVLICLFSLFGWSLVAKFFRGPVW